MHHIVILSTSTLLHVFHSLQLFDFDIEVGPILEVIVGKTVEQALLEVMEEEELASLRAQQVCAAHLPTETLASGSTLLQTPLKIDKNI